MSGDPTPVSTPASPLAVPGRRLGLGLLALGLVARALPLLDHGGRVLRQFPTEDGYLMLTIARNLALGNGPSIADGTILTNGTQPLATLLWAVCFWLVGGDRFWGVLGVQLLEIAIACGAACLMWRLGCRLLQGRPHGSELALLATGVWFASPVVVAHSMNCLESGLYVACVLIVALHVLSPRREATGPTPLDATHWAVAGAALGLAFWARNDAVLLCLAVALGHLGGVLVQTRAPFALRFAQLSIAGATVTVLALPWLAFNWLGFGHLMPISGQAESLTARFAGNLALVPPKLFEYATLLTPIPAELEGEAWVIAASLLALLLAGAWLVPRARRWDFELRALLVLGVSFALLLSAFYGLYFGAPHFMSRYLLPVSPFFALVAAAALEPTLRARALPRGLAMAAATTAAVLALGLNVRIYVYGAEHAHFQVVEWVQDNVPSDTWVGAIQTGTLGFFHDRTLNLDGKVNPAALEARKRDAIPSYVAASPIHYLVDWTGIATWQRKPEVRSTFDLIVDDPTRNLAVLRRRESGQP